MVCGVVWQEHDDLLQSWAKWLEEVYETEVFPALERLRKKEEEEKQKEKGEEKEKERKFIHIKDWPKPETPAPGEDDWMDLLLDRC